MQEKAGGPKRKWQQRRDEPYVARMRELRLKAGLTQGQVARAIGTSQTMYARYERGASELPIRHLIRLADYYGVSTDYILCRTDQIK